MSTEYTNSESHELPQGRAPHRPAGRPGGAQPQGDDSRHREEVVGRGSGGTAGGPPAFDSSGVGDSASVLGQTPESREGDSSNTPSQKTITGGEDWLSVNFYVNFPNFGDLSEKLDLAQAAAVDLDSKSSSDKTPTYHDEIEFAGIRFIVAPRGARLGAGGKALGMKWRLKSQHGLSVLIANMPDAHKTVPNVNITATSLPLMLLGFETVWTLMRQYVEALGGGHAKNKLSRVDACVDLTDVSVIDFCTPFSNDWVVSRARQRDSYESGVFLSSHKVGRQPTGFAVGKSPLRLRVYDKLAECRRSPEKVSILAVQRWGHVPEKATRVEIQLSRAKLRQFGVDTVEDWISKRSAIVDRLTCDWFRLTEGPVDRNHASRTPMHPAWSRVREDFFKWCDGSRKTPLDPLPKLHVDMSAQLAQIVGMFIGIFARVGKPIVDNAEFFREVEFAVRDVVGKRDMSVEVQRRALETMVNPLTNSRSESDENS